METAAAPVLPFLLLAAPLCLYAAWSDLKFMRIPNWLSIAALVGFIVLGLIFLPISLIGWRLLAGFVVLVIGFLLNMMGILGGGDAKFGAAMIPFIAYGDFGTFALIFAGMLILTLILHRLARATPIKNLAPDWESWHSGKFFPMGSAISSAVIFYLTAQYLQTA